MMIFTPQFPIGITSPVREFVIALHHPPTGTLVEIGREHGISPPDTTTYGLPLCGWVINSYVIPIEREPARGDC